MISHQVYSIMLELRARITTTISSTTGHQAHALFLDLIGHIDPALATRLHDEPDYRPFTVSPLMGAREQGPSLLIQEGASYHLRVTLLDGGYLWQCLTRHLLEDRQLTLQIGPAQFLLERVLSTPSADETRWAASTTWQELTAAGPRSLITLRFATPTAFSMGRHQFALFPEPLLVWDSLLRTWNRNSPEVLHIDKIPLREFIGEHVVINDYTLHTTTLRFPKHLQKGFMGTCTYLIKDDRRDPDAAQCVSHLASLAEFARYAGIGYKTTMGMGQTRLERS